jgi:beta-glucosidase
LEIITRFLPTSSGPWRVGFSGVGAFALELDGELVLEETFVRDRLDMDSVGAHAPQSSVVVELEEGKPLEVLLRYRWADDFFLFSTGFGVQQILGEQVEELARAAELARSADVAIVMVGTTEAEESEGRDRSDLRLQGGQDALVAAVAAANPRTVVVVNAGSPVEMPWREDVAALLVQWFPGMEAGNALADVLLGVAEPGGRLPTTWPVDLAGAPVTAVTPTDGQLRYDEGVHIGHRAYLRSGTEPAYWFGYGLGYTTWEYESLQATSASAVVRVRNTGDRAGKEVVQVYVSRPESAVERPAKVLAGYAVVHAGPGEARDVTVAVDQRMLRHWDGDTASWQVEAGRLDVHAGPHCGQLPLCATTELSGA